MPSSGDISKITLPTGNTYDVRDTSKVPADQGSENAGKFLVVGNDGYVTVITLATWQGGNY